MNTPREPTDDECNKKAAIELPEGDNRKAFACWYPQMGGSGSKCVIAWFTPEADDHSPCFEAYVWHDGEFPFSEHPPAELHHCSADQFIRFGQLVKGKIEGAK